MQWGALAAAAAVLFAVLYLGRDAIDAMMGPGGARATVVSADRGLYRLTSSSADLSAEARSAKVEARSAKVEGSLEAGAAIGERESVRTGPGAHAVLRLADGSIVDVNERTELFVTAAWSGQAIHLLRGDIIVKAAKQRRGRLRVLTRDSIASVKGTVFAVSAGMGGSVVSVVEGSVAVNQPRRQVVLSAGEQAASIPALTSSVAEAVAWSPDAESYLELLGSFVKIERELAKFPAELRTNSGLLAYLPAQAIVYGTAPNPGVTIGRALALAEEQSAQNATFGAWWNSETGRQLKEMMDRVQSVNPLLGDEIVFCASLAPGLNDPVPMVMARVKPGKRAELASALEKLFVEAGEAPGSYSVSDDLVVVSDSPSSLAWALAQLGQGAGSPFAAAIGERYRRGVGWLVAIDAPPVVKEASGDDAPPIEFAGMVGMRYLFLEQRAPAGAEENEVTFAFEGTRTGMGSWLADTGSGGAAEYLPADALIAGYASTREPMQLFEEFTAQIAKSAPDYERGLAAIDEKLGAGFMQDLTAALGTESALALTGFSTSGPTWVMASVANNPSVIDSSLQKLAKRSTRSWARPAGQADRVRAGDRGRTDLEHDETGWTSDGHHLDVQSGLHGGGIRSRRRGACHRDAERRLAARLVSGVPRPATVVCRTPSICLRLAQRERGTRSPVDAGPEPGARRAHGRARSDPRGVRWNAGTDPRGQPYWYLWVDHGRDADREPEPGDRWEQ